MLTITLAVKNFSPVVRNAEDWADAGPILDELIYQQYDMLGRIPEAALVRDSSGRVLDVYDVQISGGTCQKVKR